MRKISITLFCLALINCAPQASSTQISTFRNSIPTCSGEDCKDKWAAAQVWFTSNLDMKIQISNDTLIETYNPTGDSFTEKFGGQVVKEPLGGGRYRIVVKLNSTHTDEVNIYKKQIAFNEYVNQFTKSSGSEESSEEVDKEALCRRFFKRNSKCTKDFKEEKEAFLKGCVENEDNTKFISKCLRKDTCEDFDECINN